MSLFVIPRCEHGNIILGCPDDQCEQQNAYLAQQETAMARYEEYQREQARRILGIPESGPGRE